MPTEYFYECPSRAQRNPILLTQEDIAVGKCKKWTEFEIYGGVRHISPAVWNMKFLTHLHCANNSIQKIPPEIVQLECLTCLDLSNNKLRLIPAEIGDMTSLRDLNLAHNNIRQLPYELGRLFLLNNLYLKGNPLSQDILTILSEVPNGANPTQKLITSFLDNLPVTTTSPPQRPWITLSSGPRELPCASFTVMCYNILCDKYATRQHYGYCPQWALQWEYRKRGIMEEIKHYSADIIALQEVETDQFYNLFLPELRKNGYNGIFSPKSRARTMTEAERKHVDGCAIFYNSRKFRLVKENLIEFNQLAMANAEGEGGKQMLNRVMPKDNIGLAAILETTDAVWVDSKVGETGNQQLLVCTCHVHWDPEFSDVKLVQTMMLIHELRNIIEESCISLRPGCPGPDTNSIPLVLCGDLNSLPDSGVVEYLVKGRVSTSHSDFKDFEYKDCVSKLAACGLEGESFIHPFKLEQAHSSALMPYTNYTYDFKGIIDYILYSRNSMRPVGVLGALDQTWLNEQKVLGCPHPHVPSDHLPLVVELELSQSRRS